MHINILNYINSIQLGSIDTFCDQTLDKKKLLKFIKILNYNKSSCITFCVKMFLYIYIYIYRYKYIDR